MAAWAGLATSSAAKETRAATAAASTADGRLRLKPVMCMGASQSLSKRFRFAPSEAARTVDTVWLDLGMFGISDEGRSVEQSGMTEKN
ncbi:hypothetical protein GCM10022403_097830 [Streptomyces coacervatus]|uniref:Uncharacterized protein n=1 Tax=Streptomyces coacervatus TaxID=647381 RepID=A0ABP7JQB7_9ACTN